MDAICVFDELGRPHCTEFHIKIKPPPLEQVALAVLGLRDDASGKNGATSSMSVQKDGFPVMSQVDIEHVAQNDLNSKLPAGFAASDGNDPDNNLVRIFCNGRLCSNITAFVGEENFVIFFDTAAHTYGHSPSMGDLQSMDLQMGRNDIRVEHPASAIEKSFHVWRYSIDANLVIMDIDGTITKSDVAGYIQTVYLGLFSYIHEGLVPFMNILQESFNYHIIYLTSRPFIHRRETRKLLEGIRGENGLSMPDGPLFPSKDKVLAALYREVIAKTTMQLKSSRLNAISSVFRAAGSERICPYALGIGNKEADALAYNLAGVPAERILLIDPTSKIEVWKYKQLEIMHLERLSSSKAYDPNDTYEDPAASKYSSSSNTSSSSSSSSRGGLARAAATGTATTSKRVSVEEPILPSELAASRSNDSDDDSPSTRARTSPPLPPPPPDDTQLHPSTQTSSSSSSSSSSSTNGTRARATTAR